jgi:hypothetical protein
MERLTAWAQLVSLVIVGQSTNGVRHHDVVSDTVGYRSPAGARRSRQVRESSGVLRRGEAGEVHLAKHEEQLGRSA